MNMRKTVSLFLIVLMLLVFEPKTLAEDSAKSFCVVSCDSFITVSENEADEALGVAGLSKLPAILTLCYAFDQGLISEDTTVTVGKKSDRNQRTVRVSEARRANQSGGTAAGSRYDFCGRCDYSFDGQCLRLGRCVFAKYQPYDERNRAET